jgi:hypothetical protein
MPEELKFVREIRIAQFWRRELGDDEYNRRDPDDLVRWFDAFELRGPEEIRAYLNERASRHPEMPVTGIVARAPHPTRDIVEMWLATHNKPHTAPYWYAFSAFMLCSFLVVTNLNGCQNAQSWNPPVNWLPQPAILTAGSANGAPAALSTLPSYGPPAPINVASPTAATIASQNGSSIPQSAPLGAQTGVSTGVAAAAMSSVSTSSLTSASSASASTGAKGAGAHAQSAPQSSTITPQAQ